MKYRKSMNHNYLVAECPAEYTGDYQLEMVTENRISGLLPVERRLNEGREELYYEISSLQPLGRLYEHKVMKLKDAVCLLRGIIESCAALQEYMLSEDALVLDVDELYVEPDSLKPGLLFQPWRELSFRQQMIVFAEYLMEHVEQNGAEGAMWVYRLYKAVKNDNFVLSDIERLLEERKEEGKEERKEEERMSEAREQDLHKDWQELPVADGCSFPAEGEEEETETDNKARFLFPLIMASLGILLVAGILPVGSAARLVGIGFIAAGLILFLLQLFRKKKDVKKKEKGRREVVPEESAEETELPKKEWDFSSDFEGLEDTREHAEEHAEEEEDYGKTVFIGTSDVKTENILVEKNGGKRHRMESFPFTIGKVKTCVDLPLNDRSVSRIHARILMQNGKAYLQDCHSTNGTFLNGIQLEAEEEVMLEAEDEIMIGRVCFRYL